MNSPLETGLFLPIRFYESIQEQDRYKHQSEGVSYLPENYVYIDCKTLAPFQIAMFQIDDQFDLSWDWALVCIDTEDEIIMPSGAAPQAHWEAYHDTDKNMLYLSYLGDDDFFASLYSGRFYIRISVMLDAVLTIYYSDIFIIANCDSLYSSVEYRKYSSSDSDKRLSDVNELRII